MAEWSTDLLSTAPDVVADPTELAEVRLALLGIGPGTASVTVDAATCDAATALGWLVVRDPEGAPVAALRVSEPDPRALRTERSSAGVAASASTAASSYTPLGTTPQPPSTAVRGSVIDVDGSDNGPFAALRRPPSGSRGPEGVLAIIGHDPPDQQAMTQIRAAAAAVLARATAPAVLFIVLDGPRMCPGPALPNTVRAVQALAQELAAEGRTADVVVVPAPEYGDERDDRLREQIGAAYGAGKVVPSHTINRDALLAALDSADDPPGLPAPSLAAWRHYRPRRDERGLAILFTGLSGSGKSTLARAFVQALTEESSRSVTLLDGDVVRRHLSVGLGFSRTDRDRNVLRIGFVAAEIARHGGVVVCAPIAPFADTRRQVRDMVTEHGDFVLIHVATPLEECERRDRKGLYARARAGEIPEFTGISSPYEPPDDADLVLDTATISVPDATARVLALLRRGGWLPTPPPTPR